ncbi:hypothetical protein C9374_001948 [Naegleria lovaniensis]|uniref:Erythromycin biosynthesis protein CIII-like C-terminal domain-containing protein n=1 Tax=Naegleria lovaniensis TaxID=51637 RepID=A0AA88GV67_NAELO|nr:uncharacterized protein C9374_001948 [Naegleria lovaniensis]KAG2386913.1 hypothetical protein C9374_001948 [Naegleria lovaniensis]
METIYPPCSQTIGVIAIGTRGDFQPLLAFCLDLQQRMITSNAQVYLIAPEVFRQQYEKAVQSTRSSLLFKSLKGNPKETMQDPQTQEALRTGNFATVMQLTAKPNEMLMSQCTHDLFEIAKETPFNTLMSSSMGMPIAWMLSERYEIPLVYIGLVPEAPTSDFPFCVLSPVSLGDEEKNLASYELVYHASFKRTEEMVNQQRQELGLAQMKDEGWLSLKEKYNMPIIYAFSDVAFGGKKPKGYRENIHLTGYFELKLEDDHLDLEIENFLASPKPEPVFLSFGSMPALNPFQLFELTRSVLMRNERVILSCGWTDMDKIMEDLNMHHFEILSKFTEEEIQHYTELLNSLKQYIANDRLLVIKDCPYYLLFPRCACIVHHGGAGTTGTALKSGKPQVVIPVFMDQPFWAHKMYDLGVASYPVLFKDITNEKVNEAIDCVLHQGEKSEDIKKKALLIAQQLQANEHDCDPISRAIELCLDCIKNPFIVPRIEQ